MVEWPENQVFYYGKVKDKWDEQTHATVEGKMKRKAGEGEISALKELITEHQPWKPIAEPKPSTNMMPVEGAAPNSPALKKVKREDDHAASTSSNTKWPSASPSPSPTKGEIQMDRDEYEKKMANLISLVHKVSGEWNRKGREFTIAVAKSSCNNLTTGSAVEAALQKAVVSGEGLMEGMDKIETDYAKGNDVSYKVQAQIKQDVDSVYEIIKSANKLKLLMRDRSLLHSILFAHAIIHTRQ